MGHATQLGSAGVNRSLSPELLEVSGPLNTGFLLYQSMHAPGRHWHSKMTPSPGNQSAHPSHLTDGKLSPLVGAHSGRLPRVCSRSLLLQTRGPLTLTFSFLPPWLCRFSFSGGGGCTGLACHLSCVIFPAPPPRLLHLPAGCHHPPGRLAGPDRTALFNCW